MYGIDAALDRLKPVGLLQPLGDMEVALWLSGPFEAGHRGLLILWSQVGPDDPTHLHRRIGGDANTLVEVVLRQNVGHFDALPRDVVLPAVEHAPKPVFLVAAQPQGCPPMGAPLPQQSNTAAGVAEGDQVLAQEAHAHGRAVYLRQLPRQ